MKKGIVIAAAGIISILLILGIRKWFKSDDPSIGDDEIAVVITLDTKEDIGLILFDYTADGNEYSGVLSNTDQSPIKHDTVIIQTFNKEQLNCSSNMIEQFIMKFTIITENVDQNPNNIYPIEIKKDLVPLSNPYTWFGKTVIKITITGDKDGGYIITFPKRTSAF